MLWKGEEAKLMISHKRIKKWDRRKAALLKVGGYGYTSDHHKP